jgi:hypothetical protein
MRAIPPELAERIDSGAAGLCHVWILTRADGVRLGFTDHDRDLSVDGVTCRAASGWTAGASEAATGFTPGLATALGGLDAAALTQGDLAAGLYDGAQVGCWRLDWSDPALRALLWSGRIARVSQAGAALTLEIEGPLAGLETVVGRTYGRLCDAAFGDGRCGLDLALHPGATCDKRWSTCRDSFANSLNFQGFPSLIGEDFLTLYPAEGERHDGGRR